MGIPVMIGRAVIEGIAWGGGLTIYENYIAP